MMQLRPISTPSYTLTPPYTGISKQTKDNYNAAYKHLAPIQNLVFKEIRTVQWQFCLDKTVKAGLSQSSLNKVRVLMIRLCDYAVANDITDKNYAKFRVAHSGSLQSHGF